MGMTLTWKMVVFNGTVGGLTLQELSQSFWMRFLTAGQSDHLMDRYGNTLEWPTMSPDLNQCDFYLWVYVIDRVFQTNPRIIRELKRVNEHETFSFFCENIYSRS